ncbi:MAG: peptide deformylase [Burkholderiaceae bacterium]
MTRLPVLHYPDPRLTTVARPVAQIDARIKTLVADMFATMYAEDGIGLAATQVDVHERVVVVDLSEAADQPLVLINPELLWASTELQQSKEGCLSVTQIYDVVPRAAQIRVRALDLEGQSREIEADGLLAACIQHEMDHLMGKVFIEYLSPLKRNRYAAKRSKLMKAAA